MMRVFPTHVALLFVSLGLFFLSGCVNSFYSPEKSTSLFLDTYNIKHPDSPNDFTTCNHYDCDGGGVRVSFTAEAWQNIKALFTPASINAREERSRIAEAVALMEEHIGWQNNTFADQACNNFKAPIESYQHDCVAETVNSTIYLLLLDDERLLRWHHVSYPAHRSVAAILFPHYSAVIKEIGSDDIYVVDSWFFANGEKPVIIPLALWSKNYYPKPCS
jgi:hypothetical protein